MLCADCHEDAFVNDYLCEPCRDKAENMRRCEYTLPNDIVAFHEFDDDIRVCGKRYKDDGNEACPECRKKARCEVCGVSYNTKGETRFKGLCHSCKEVARQSAPLKSDKPYCVCAHCGDEVGYSPCCDSKVKIILAPLE